MADNEDVQPSDTPPDPALITAPLQSDSTSQAAPLLDAKKVLQGLWTDHSFQSGSRAYQRAAVQKVFTEASDDNYAVLADKDREDYLNAIVDAIPQPDPYYGRKMMSKIYTPAMVTAGGVAPELLAPGLGTAGVFGGMAAGLAGAHAIDRMTGISRPLNSAGGVASELVKTGIETGANMAIGSALGPVLGGMKLAPADREFLETARNMGVDIPADAVDPHSPILGTLSAALRTLPGSRQVMSAFDQNTAEQMVRAHRSILENGDVNMSLEDYGNALQKHLDDFVRDNTNMTATEGLKLKNAILSRLGSPLSYDELGMTAQKQAQSYTEDMGKTADALYTHARESFNPDFPAKIGVSRDGELSTGEMAHTMRAQLLESQPQFQDSTTHSLLKNLSGEAEVENMVGARQAEIEKGTKAVLEGYPGGPSEFLKLPPEAQATIKKQFGIPEPISETEVKAFLEGRTMPLSKLMRLKSDLGNSIRAIDHSTSFVTGPTPGFGTLDSGMLRQVNNSVHGDIAAAFKEGSPEAQKAFDAANQYYKAYMGEIDKSALKNVLRSQSPETIYDGLVKPGMVTGIDTARRFMQPQAFEQVRGRFMNDFLDTGTDVTTGESNPLTGAFVRKQIAHWSPQTINRLLDHETSAALYKLPDQLDALSDTLPDNPIFKKILDGPGGPSVVDGLYRKGGTQNVKDVMSAMDPEGQKLMKQAFLGKLLATNSHGNVSGNAMDAARNAYGEDMVNMMIGDPAEQKKVGDFINMAYRQRSRMAATQNPSQTGMAFMAARLLKQVFSTGPIQAIAQFAPAELTAKVYTNPAVQKWLTDGIMPYGRQAALPLANLFAGVAEGGGDESTHRR